MEYIGTTEDSPVILVMYFTLGFLFVIVSVTIIYSILVRNYGFGKQSSNKLLTNKASSSSE